MANDSTTAEQLVMQALEKIDIGSQEHGNFCIVEKTVGENGIQYECHYCTCTLRYSVYIDSIMHA